MKVPISDIVFADDINIRQELRQDAVDRYAEILDDLPPIQIWQPNGKMLLVDGWHRIAAAKKIGRSEIEAEVHKGDRTEAMVAAILANTAHGVPLSMAERDEGIVRLAKAGWSHRRIAKAIGKSASRIEVILRTASVPMQGLAPSIREEAAQAPREWRLPVAQAALDGGWEQRATREVARQLADPLIAEDDKRRIVETQLVRREDGQVGVPAALVSSMLRDAKARAASPAIYGFTAAAAELLGKLRVDPEPLAGLNPDEYSGILRGLDDAELAITKVRRLIAEVAQ